MSDAKEEYLKCYLCQKVMSDTTKAELGSDGWAHGRCALEALEDILSFINEEHRLVVVKGAAAARMVTIADKTNSLMAILGALNRGHAAPWAEALEKTVEGLHMFEEGNR